jgi:hypothetical protein
MTFRSGATAKYTKYTKIKRHERDAIGNTFRVFRVFRGLKKIVASPYPLLHTHHEREGARPRALSTMTCMVERVGRGEAKLGSGSIWWGEAPDEPGSRGRSRHRKGNLTHYPKL